MDRRGFLRLLGAAPIVGGAALAASPESGECHVWYHYSVRRRLSGFLGWKHKDERIHICVRAPSGEQAYERLKLDDPIWMGETKFHGQYVEAVQFMPLPDRFIGWTMPHDASEGEVLLRRHERFGEMVAKLSGVAA